MARAGVRKTPKLFINGKFVRSESGRTYRADDKAPSNVALASRKDVRDAVRAARAAVSDWSSRTAYNRGQILYRLAEMVESRRAEFDVGTHEFAAAVDEIVWYAGWCDKIEQVLSTKNPVAGPHFNVSAPEPTGVVAAIAPKHSALAGLVAATLPALCGGNAVVAAASPRFPLQAIAFAEALATSDVPPGAVNILTGDSDALAVQLARHMDVNAIAYWGDDARVRALVQEHAAENVKRCELLPDPSPNDLARGRMRTPWRVAAFMEIKTVWHPAGL